MLEWGRGALYGTWGKETGKCFTEKDAEGDAEGNKKRCRRELKGMRKAIRGAANCNMKGMITAIRLSSMKKCGFYAC